MKAVVFAYHDMGCTGIQALLDAGYDIAAIFTHPDNPGENHFFGSVARLAAEQGIPVWAPEDVNHPLWTERIREMKPDVLFSFYYRNLLGDEILNLAPKGAFNLHGSLLPKYRGRAPLNWVLVNGESETGVTLHRMVNRADAGDIVAQQAVAIGADDAALTLHRKLCAAATELLSRALPAILAGTTDERPQDHSQATYVGRRTPEDGRLDWEQPAQTLHNLVRAVSIRGRAPSATPERTSLSSGNPAFATICQQLNRAPCFHCAADRRVPGRGAGDCHRPDRTRRVHAGRSAGAGAGPGVRGGDQQQTGGGD